MRFLKCNDDFEHENPIFLYNAFIDPKFLKA